jgi:hypothetical protein
MPSQTDIVNIALSHLCEKTVMSIDEKSVEAKTAKEFYWIALHETLRDFSWPFATNYVNLNLVVNQTQNYNWAYVYQYPSDCLYFRRIVSGLSQDSRQTRVPFIIAKSDFINAPAPNGQAEPETSFTPPLGSGLYIFTNQPNAQAEYTMQIGNSELYPSDFIMAFSYRLASLMAPRITGGDPFKLKDSCLASYDMEITKAKASSFNEEQTPDELPSEFQRNRNGMFYPDGIRPPWYPSPSGFSID